ncbi:hypothetical protein [Proteus mirabilis]|uniref:hypothetical protein n=1 Tax=Proteus mirabilis TaxID=584 RepID=UPI0034D5E241
MQKTDGYKLARKLFDINQIMKKRVDYLYNSNDQNFYGVDKDLFVNTRLQSNEFKKLLEEGDYLPSMAINGQEFFEADKAIKEYNRIKRKEDPEAFASKNLKKELYFDIKTLTLRDKEDGNILYEIKRVRHRDVERNAFKWDKKPRKIPIYYINGLEIANSDKIITDFIKDIVVDLDLYSWTMAIFEEDNEIVFTNNHEIMDINTPYIQTNKNLFIKLDATKKKIESQFFNIFIEDSNDELQQVGIEYGTSDYKITHCANIVLRF